MAESMKDALPMFDDESDTEGDMRAMEVEELAELLGLDSEKATRLLDLLKPPMGMEIAIGEVGADEE